MPSARDRKGPRAAAVVVRETELAALWKQPRVIWEASSLTRNKFDRLAGPFIWPGTHAADAAAGNSRSLHALKGP